MPKLNVIRSPELTPFWQRPPERYGGDTPARTDVLVIGGGVPGMSLMHHPRARGTQAALVERAHISAGRGRPQSGVLPVRGPPRHTDRVSACGQPPQHTRAAT